MSYPLNSRVPPPLHQGRSAARVTNHRFSLRGIASYVIIVFVLLTIAACTPSTSITEDELLEIRRVVADLEERLTYVNERLVRVGSTADVEPEAADVISQSAHETEDIAEILAMIASILDGASAP